MLPAKIECEVSERFYLYFCVGKITTHSYEEKRHFNTAGR